MCVLWNTWCQSLYLFRMLLHQRAVQCTWRKKGYLPPSRHLRLVTHPTHPIPCFLGFENMNGYGIIRNQTHDFRITGWTLFCCSTWESVLHKFPINLWKQSVCVSSVSLTARRLDFILPNSYKTYCVSPKVTFPHIKHSFHSSNHAVLNWPSPCLKMEFLMSRAFLSSENISVKSKVFFKWSN